MSEIESTSRLYRMKDAVCVTLPLPHRDPDGIVSAHPLALIVTPKALLTVSYQALKPCEPEFQAGLGVDRSHPNSIGATIAVLESIVDHLADELELLTARLNENSRKIFAKQTTRSAPGRGQMLKSLIPEIGRQREYSSLLEESLLTLSRALPFLESELAARLTPETHARLQRIDRDVQSLSSHEGRMSEKAQFMLDASLGLIGVEQNDIFKVLTIVSVIGIPPTLIASMYGMNFKNIPEYDWTCRRLAATGITPVLVAPSDTPAPHGVTSVAADEVLTLEAESAFGLLHFRTQLPSLRALRKLLPLTRSLVETRPRKPPPRREGRA